MLFNSYIFLFVFLPLCLFAFYRARRSMRPERGIYVLIAFSLVFYMFWSVPYSAFLLCSLVVNYFLGRAVIGMKVTDDRRYGWVVLLGVLLNLTFLGYFKYTGFLLQTADDAFGFGWTIPKIILPLGISFYTFQKIAFLVDCGRGHVKDRGFARYSLFVLFFPQLISGPIVHYRELEPQFESARFGRFPLYNIIIGLTIVGIGLAKKTLIADTAALYSSPLYEAANNGEVLSFYAAWQAALCYTLQLYFDFSGYTDMAIGLARCFSIKLPLNFHSPHKAISIIDYWRRWHSTLQRFFVSYVYQPIALPLVRFAVERNFGKWGVFAIGTALPTLTVFTLSGIWHGAGWTFVIWGVMHASYMIVNEAWRLFRAKSRKKRKGQPSKAVLVYFAITIFAVILSNVMFRAPTIHAAFAVYAGMFDFAGALSMPITMADATTALFGPIAILIVGFSIIFIFPNTQQIMRRYEPALNWKTFASYPIPLPSFEWRPTFAWALFSGILFALGIIFMSGGHAEFIYFNF